MADQIKLERNLVHKAIKHEISTILKQISQTAVSHFLAWLNSVWNPPLLDYFKANFDAAIRLNMAVEATTLLRLTVAINRASLFSYWIFAPIIEDIHQQLILF